ncbi:MAG TPA: SDR family oxidoreductase, partial [Kofleriaceae bacterium]|nr:SDR family oxidoreductase [Kofleriaceae bacterium]
IADVRSGLEHKLLAQLSVAQASLATLAAAGSITFVSSASARMAIAGTTGLAAINAGIEAAVRTLALELAPIRVNAVSPVRRVGHPEDVAAAIAMVATNGFMTGTVLAVDGGAPLAR